MKIEATERQIAGLWEAARVATEAEPFGSDQFAEGVFEVLQVLTGNGRSVQEFTKELRERATET